MRKEIFKIAKQLVRYEDSLVTSNVFKDWISYILAVRLTSLNYNKKRTKKIAKRCYVLHGKNNVILSLWQLTKLYKLKRIKI